MFSHFRTVSPGLGYNYASKSSFDSFPHTKYTSPRTEHSQNHTLMFDFSPIPGRRFEKQGKLWKNLSHSFPCFSNLLPGLEKNETSMCGSESFPCMVTYIFCVENCQNYMAMAAWKDFKKCLKASWRRCYYQYRSRDALSPVCGIF